jgi:hypothetical protein
LAYHIARYRYRAVPEPSVVTLHHRPELWAYALGELGNAKAMWRLPSSGLREFVVYWVVAQLGCGQYIMWGLS